MEDSVTIISQDQVSDGGNVGELSNVDEVSNASKAEAISETQNNARHAYVRLKMSNCYLVGDFS